MTMLHTPPPHRNFVFPDSGSGSPDFPHPGVSSHHFWLHLYACYAHSCPSGFFIAATGPAQTQPGSLLPTADQPESNRGLRSWTTWPLSACPASCLPPSRPHAGQPARPSAVQDQGLCTRRSHCSECWFSLSEDRDLFSVFLFLGDVSPPFPDAVRLAISFCFAALDCIQQLHVYPRSGVCTPQTLSPACFVSTASRTGLPACWVSPNGYRMRSGVSKPSFPDSALSRKPDRTFSE